MAHELIDYTLDKLKEMSTHGFEDFLDVEKDNYTLNLTKAKEKGALNNIKKLTVDRMNKLTIELYDQLEILALMSKLAGAEPSKEKTENLTLDDIIEKRKKILGKERDTDESENE